MTIKPISKNNVILQKGDECIFSTFTNDYPNLHIDQKITIADVYDNGVVCVDNGTNIQVNVLANQIDKIWSNTDEPLKGETSRLLSACLLQ
mgnify:CR=1 FL=1